MREIKFRCFYRGKMYHVIELYEGTVNAINMEIEGVMRQISPDSEHVKGIMQFTGLLDKNKTPIFEGDVVKILYTDWVSKTENDPRTLDQYLSDIAKKGTIEYEQDGFYFVTIDRYGDKNYSHINPGTHGFIEVIGNIYETPELL